MSQPTHKSWETGDRDDLAVGVLDELLAQRTVNRPPPRWDRRRFDDVIGSPYPNWSPPSCPLSPIPSDRVEFPRDNDWGYRAVMTFCVVCALSGSYLLWSGLAPYLRNRPAVPPSVAATIPRPSAPRYEVRAAPIEQIRVFQRVAGKNPLHDESERAVADPDPATWRLLRLQMVKESGKLLDINLARPLDWIEQVGAIEGEIFFLGLPEMGVAGDAMVLALGPCPPLDPGPGSVVTGTFAHEADDNLVELQLSDGSKPIGVTTPHPFWSEDRQEFVPVGELRQGERVRTMKGVTQVVSITPKPVRAGERVYNLEVHGEHVFHVGGSGVLVHNACAERLRKAMQKTGRYGDEGTVPHHMVPRGSYNNNRHVSQAQDVLDRNGIDLDSHWNGVNLPSSRLESGARGAIHERIHTNPYFQNVAERLRKAEATNGGAGVLQALQRIRSELLDGSFPTVRPGNVQ